MEIEHAFDAISVPITAIVRMVGRLAVGPWRDDRQDTVHQRVLAQAVTVVALVGQQGGGLGETAAFSGRRKRIRGTFSKSAGMRGLNAQLGHSVQVADHCRSRL